KKEKKNTEYTFIRTQDEKDVDDIKQFVQKSNGNYKTTFTWADKRKSMFIVCHYVIIDSPAYIFGKECCGESQMFELMRLHKAQEVIPAFISLSDLVCLAKRTNEVYVSFLKKVGGDKSSTKQSSNLL
ncbi:hypothetical protein RFI_38769, partial [Reticulomyxa filosa]